MSISASLVKQLREQTGCPMMDCKKALVEAGGDLSTAQDILRKRGHESASKRKDRATAEGIVAGFADPDGKRAALAELLCETDFVAKNDDFTSLARSLAEDLVRLPGLPGDEEAFLASVAEGRTGTVADRIREVQNTLKENIRLGRFRRLDAGEGERTDVYVHFNGKIGTAILLGMSSPALAEKPAVLELLKDLCMQTAFSAPLALQREDMPEDIVEKERSVLAGLDEVKSKPEKVQPKIVEGKLNKFFKEKTLLEQEFVKEKKVAVKKVLQRVGKEAGGSLDIKDFVRLEVGET